MFIQMQDVVKKYGAGENTLYALDHASLELERGGICVILGPSGSGKSTLLNMLGGLDSADEGGITVDGCTISALSKKELLEYRRKKVGIVFQTYNLVAELTVRENIKVVSDISISPLPVDELLKELGLERHAAHFPAELSGGQQQRCAITRSIVKNPAVLLCDEPTGALDSKSSRDVLQLLQDINAKYRTTILLITHNESIAQMADRIVRIRDGKITENRMNGRKPVKEPKINRAVVFEGSPLGDCNDVLITYNYAKAQGISVDDTITLADRKFTVCGLCIRPDYAAMYANFEDSFPNSVDFGIAVITKDAMEQLGEYSGLYSVKYPDASQEAAFRAAVSERYQTLEYVMKSVNPRTGALLTQAGDLEAEFSVYSPIIMLAVVVVIAMVLIRTVKRDGKTIGTLMALGYRKGELIAHYMRYALIPAVFGDILGLALCYPFSKLFNIYIFNFAEHINYSVKLPVGILIIALALPPLILTARAPRRCFAGRSEMI